LLRCYTQNIDGLEFEAGVSEKRIVYAHGSLQYATCCNCKRKSARSELEGDIWAGQVARCPALLPKSSKTKPCMTARSSSTGSANNSGRVTRKRPLDGPPSCINETTMRTRGVAQKERTCGGVLKPGVTFFGEALGDNVRRCLEADYSKVDALIVIGTSLSV
jgi:NAD-dependent SIR2 family protein deacetylase